MGVTLLVPLKKSKALAALFLIFRVLYCMDGGYMQKVYDNYG